MPIHPPHRITDSEGALLGGKLKNTRIIYQFTKIVKFVVDG